MSASHPRGPASSPASAPPDGSDPPAETLRTTLDTIIFGTETFYGRLFDIAILIAILLSILTVTLDSVVSLHTRAGRLLGSIEWVFTGLFTVEYALRLYATPRRLRYAVSFFGIVDLLSLLPTYVALVFNGMDSLLAIRVLRLLRVFRVLKIVRMLREAHALSRAVRASLPKIGVFMAVVMTVIVIAGSAMYVIEGAQNGFTSIPFSMYWAIVTMTTVGYGDIAPQTPLGQVLASILMIAGYGILAVPTGIVSAELVQEQRTEADAEDDRCRGCGTGHHPDDAIFCRVCGAELIR